MTLGGVIASQLGSLQDLKTYVTAAATGMLSSNGFVWLVTDSTGHLGVLATYGAGTLLVDERLQTFSPNSSIELGGTYVPAENLAAASPGQPEAPPAPPSTASGLAPLPLRTEPSAAARAFSTSALVRSTVGGGRRPANVWSDAASAGLRTGRGGYRGSQDGMDSLDRLGQTLFPLFCVSVHEHAWMAGGYGVWGREAYLERFWSCLDWAAVRDAYARYRQRQQKHWEYRS
jgi:Fe-Mn family superoxide dismutase